MMYPTIHLNGTGKQMLLDGYLDARRAVTEAQDKLAAVEFNGRDYYPQGPNAFEAARVEHEDRLRRLKAIADELLAIAMHIQDAEK